MRIGGGFNGRLEGGVDERAEHRIGAVDGGVITEAEAGGEGGAVVDDDERKGEDQGDKDEGK